MAQGCVSLMAQHLEQVLAPGIQKAWPTAQVMAGGYGGTALNLAGALHGQTLPQPSSPRGSLSRSACTPLDECPCLSPGSRPVFFSLSPSISPWLVLEAEPGGEPSRLRPWRSEGGEAAQRSARGVSQKARRPLGQWRPEAPQNQAWAEAALTDGGVECDMEMWEVNPKGTVKKR